MFSTLKYNIPADIVRDYGLVTMFCKQGFILYAQKLFSSIKQLPLISTVLHKPLSLTILSLSSKDLPLNSLQRANQ